MYHVGIKNRGNKEKIHSFKPFKEKNIEILTKSS